MTSGRHVISLFELDLEPLALEFAAVHAFDGEPGALGVVIADKAVPPALAILGHDPGGEDIAVLFEDGEQLGIAW
jgi:hypothetical protein